MGALLSLWIFISLIVPKPEFRALFLKFGDKFIEIDKEILFWKEIIEMIFVMNAALNPRRLLRL